MIEISNSQINIILFQLKDKYDVNCSKTIKNESNF